MKILEIYAYKNNIKIIFLGIKISVNKNFQHRIFKIKYLLFTQLAKILVKFIQKNKTQKYSHIVSFGKNCEPAKQMNDIHGKVEATLFSWATYEGSDIKTLLKAIKNPDIIFSKDVKFIEQANMYDCIATKIQFHGSKAPYELLDKDGNLDKEKYEKEKNDTFEKIKYLAQKNENIYNLPDKKLYVMTIDYNSCEDIEVLKDLHQYLSTKNPNFDMLIIVEESKLNDELNDFRKNYNNIFIRTVCCFNRKLGLKIIMPLKYYIDWAKIFTEFTSTAKNIKKKKLKCD